MGLREVSENDPWLVYWTDASIPFDRLLDIKRFQKVNHFPGMSEVCRKDLLARNLKRMLKIFPKEYNIFPRTFCLPADFSDLLAFAGTKKKTLICKPDTGCQGRGIFIIRTLKMLNPVEKLVVQHYITKPFLIDGYKFDLRLYVLVTAVDPEFRIYVYKEGLARFATVKYEKPTGRNVNNMFMHLTNYAVNKHSNYYVHDDAAGSKRKLSAVNDWWNTHGYCANEIWKRVDDIIVKTLVAASGTLKHNYRTCFPNHVGINACFEILGFDVILDHKLMPYVLEVNLSPSFHVDTLIDKEVKEGLIRNTFEILNLDICNPRRCAEEDRRKAQLRLLNSIRKPDESTKCQLKLEQQELANETVSSTELYELQHIGNYRLVYPIHSYSKIYDKYFLNSAGIYQETAASRAREECNRIQRSQIAKQKIPKLTAKKEKVKLVEAVPEKKKRVQMKLPKVTGNVSSTTSRSKSSTRSSAPATVKTSTNTSATTTHRSESSSSSSAVTSASPRLYPQEERQYAHSKYSMKMNPCKSEIAKNIDYLLSKLSKQQLYQELQMKAFPVANIVREFRIDLPSSSYEKPVYEYISTPPSHRYSSLPWKTSFLPGTDPSTKWQRSSTKSSSALLEKSGTKPPCRSNTTKISSGACTRVRVTRAYLARVESNLEKIKKMDSLKKKPTSR